MDKQIRNKKDLQAAIIELEQRKAKQEKLLIDELHATYESIKPVNLLKRVASSPVVRNSVVKAAVGLGVGVLSKNILVGKTVGTFGKIIGNVLKFGVAALVAKNSGKTKEKENGIIKKV